mgnify:CR=1 FL=1
MTVWPFYTKLGEIDACQIDHNSQSLLLKDLHSINRCVPSVSRRTKPMDQLIAVCLFTGHYLDQRRLKQGLYRHPWDDISYVMPEQN